MAIEIFVVRMAAVHPSVTRLYAVLLIWSTAFVSDKFQEGKI